VSGHYDIPGGWIPPVLVRSPNLGQPRFVDWAQREPVRLLMAMTDPAMDIRSMLDRRLFLQSLPDTRRFLQDATSRSPDLGHARPADCPRFIPLTIQDVDDVVASSWRWGRGRRLTTYPYASWVTCTLPDRLPACVRAGQLFNVVQLFSKAVWANVNFHAVYLSDHDWQDFTVCQISDTHIAWRNDTVCTVLEPRFPGMRDRFINFNQNLRDFIRYANARHGRGTLDAIVLTGDIVDYIRDNFNQRIGRKRAWDLGAEPYGHAPIDNFELFRDLVVAWPSHPGVVVGDELEVPLFTVPGNHDYRRNEYPLIHKLQIEVAGIDLSSLHSDPIREYSTFDLTEDEACAYEGGVVEIDDARAASFVEHETGLPLTYAMLINPDADYRVALGPHSLVGLDTGHDDGLVTAIMDYLLRRGSGKMFVEGSPNSVGFSDGQIRFLREQVDDTKGLLFVVCHAPLLNFRHTPHHFLRESEHQRAFTQEEQDELVAALLSNHPKATELEQYWPLAAGGSHALVTGDPVSSGIVAGISYIVKWLSGSSDSPADRLRKRGWQLGGTRGMKTGGLDNLIGWGVAAHRFSPFVRAIESRVNQGETACLVLSGHTHQAIEYVVTARDSGPIRLYHDYYLDNTIHGRRPQSYWYSEQLPDAEDITDPTMAWHNKSPLLVQTIALGPKPAGRMPPHAQATPYGQARVTSGRFALYDLRPGTYVLRYIADDRSVSAVGAMDVGTKKGTCGSPAVTLYLVPKSGVVPPLTDIDHPADAFAKRDLGTGHTVVVGGWLKPRPGGSAASGTVYVARAPKPKGGALEIDVVHGEIASMRRVSLGGMRLAQRSKQLDIKLAAGLWISMP
jgi:3',5'-cyclic AMP phosphodiesterase CpdA